MSGVIKQIKEGKVIPIKTDLNLIKELESCFKRKKTSSSRSNATRKEI